MALLFMDGFDAGDYAVKYNYNGLGGLNTSASTRFGTGLCLSKAVNNSAGAIRKSITPSASIIAGFAGNYTFNYSGFPAVFLSVAGDSGATSHIQVATADNPGYIEVSRGLAGSRTVLFTAPVSTNAWHYYELRVKVDSTVGYATLRVDGVQVGTFSGNTKNGGTSTNIDTLLLQGTTNNTGVYMYWDDLYVIDETGSLPYNTFLGDVRVHTMVPSAAGASTQFTPSAGANYTDVDELPYSAADYVRSATPGNRDTYAMTDLPAGATTIYGVQNNIIAKKTDAGSISLKPTLRSGGTNYYGPSSMLGTSDAVVTDVRQLDPATSAAWTAGGVNGIESGMEVA